MQTLIFQTTTKTVQLLSGPRGDSKVLETYENVPTVKIHPDGYYEVMQRTDDDISSISSTIPVLRVPITNTNMLIQK